MARVQHAKLLQRHCPAYNSSMNELEQIEELAEQGQSVHGLIIALEDDKRIRRALSVVPNIQFYRYQVSFKLVKA